MRVGLVQDLWMGPLVLFVVVAVFYLVDLNHLPSFDELYHVLAARGWLADGVPRIADGIYTRAELFTVLVAVFFRVFGESLLVARLPSLFAGTMLVVLVFIWTRTEAGRLAAWIAALFMALASLNIELALFARFYTLQALLFGLAAIGVYTLTIHRPAWTISGIILGGSVLCLAVAWHLQELTLIGAAGVALWLALWAGVPWLIALRGHGRGFWAAVGAVASLLLLAALVATQADFVRELLDRYRWSATWNIENRNAFWFYHVYLLQGYPTLWSIFPLVALVAMAAKPRPAFLCCVMFTVAFVLLSFGGMKSDRYLYFVMPFLFVIWGIALAATWSFLKRCVVRATNRSLLGVAPYLPRRPARRVLVALAVGFVVFANGAVVKTLMIPLGVRLSGGEGANLSALEVRADWGAARTALEPWLETAAVVVTTRDLYALYYLGRHDILLNRSRVRDTQSAEFGRDERTGRPVISTAESTRLVLECYPDGLIVADSVGWRDPKIVGDAVADLIESQTVPIEVPAAAQVKAFRWHLPSRGAPPAACGALPRLTTDGKAAAAAAHPGSGWHSLATATPSPPNLAVMGTRSGSRHSGLSWPRPRSAMTELLDSKRSSSARIG
jgi:4-amino-4-deoxy-L-arabinose transferase-like glycosyltransferase